MSVSNYIDNRNDEDSELSDKDTLSYARYLKPILTAVGDAKHIYFAADGVYHKINLNTLWTDKQQYVGQKWNIHQVASTRDLVKRKAEEVTLINPKAVLFGNPSCRINSVEHDSLAAKLPKTKIEKPLATLERGDERDELGDLPAAKAEVMALDTILKQQGFEVKTYIGKEALEEEVQNLQHPTIVHFATHGGFGADAMNRKQGVYNFYDNPMYKSKLYFVGAVNVQKQPKTLDSLLLLTEYKHEDGILYAAEAALLDLEGTELVVLSACETGLGTIQNGEGVFGLRRAFRIAGVKDLIMSLWKVDDGSSQEFMTLFYENWLAKKMSKYEAFHQAQLSLIQKYPHEPKKWGGFILMESNPTR